MNTIIITHNDQEFASKIAELLFDKYVKSIKLYDSFNIGLTGGNTPKLIYKCLVTSYLDKFDWNKVNFFFVDERCVPMDSPNSNYNLANELLFSFLPTANVYRFETELPGEEGVKKYRDYLIKETIHCALLGMGEDGHVGSIFPNAYEEYTQESVIITKDAHNGWKRFSLSIDSINRIRDKILMINKSQIKEEIIKQKNKNLPINKIENMTIIINS